MPASPFDNVPAIYDRVRPGYPEPLFDALFAALPQREGPARILEVGPGTGQATASLLERGAAVTAVEVGANLAAFLTRKFSTNPRLTVVNAAFEETSLGDGAWDLVTAATAFHWIDPAERMARAHALLVPGGVLGIIDTIQVRDPADRGYFERSQPIYARYWPDQAIYQPAPEPDVVPPVFEEMRASGLFEDVSVQRWRWDQRYEVDAYIDLVRSYSNTYDLEPAAREAFLDELRAMVTAEEGSSVLRPLVITLTMGRKARPATER